VKDFLVNNKKTFLAILISFISVFFVFPYFLTPGKLTNTLADFSSSVASFKFPKIFSLNYSVKRGTVELPESQSRSFVLPTVYQKPTIALLSVTPQETEVNPTEKISGSPTKKPTKILTKIKPTPTPYIKPTSKPNPSPTPLAPPEYLRPGTGLDDIFKKAGELSCVPPALLKAFVAQEAPGVLNWSDQTALFYNAYDWWHRVKEVKQVCAGYGFYTHTGLVAEDSMFAGEKCKNPFSPETANDTYSRVLGSCQMLRSYWENDFKEPTRQKLKVSKVDRRVLIDCLVGYGIHFREDAGYSGSCGGDWDMKYVAKAACVNAGGTCDYYNYCYTICNNYNKYANKNYNCNNAAGLFVPGSFCQFK